MLARQAAVSGNARRLLPGKKRSVAAGSFAGEGCVRSTRLCDRCFSAGSTATAPPGVLAQHGQNKTLLLKQGRQQLHHQGGRRFSSAASSSSSTTSSSSPSPSSASASSPSSSATLSSSSASSSSKHRMTAAFYHTQSRSRNWPPPASSAFHSNNARQAAAAEQTALLSDDQAAPIVQQFARRQSVPFLVSEMVRSGLNPTPERRIKNARFLWNELPTRLAGRAKELGSLPYGLSETEPIKFVRSWYVSSLRELLSVREPSTPEDDEEFTKVLQGVVDRHAETVPTMARGILMLQQRIGSAPVDDCPFLKQFLDSFYSARIAMRVLINHHIAMHFPRAGHAGFIEMDMSPVDVAEMAAADASRLCERNYGVAPEVIIKASADDMRMPYIPSHLHHMLHELLKNSMRATVEFSAPSSSNIINNGNGNGSNNGGGGTQGLMMSSLDPESLPPIEVVIADGGDQEVAIRVSDMGGGISSDQSDRIWTYLFTTAGQPVQASLVANPADPVAGGSGPGVMHNAGMVAAPMAGFGYGLPLSRLYARFFGGDLDVVSIEGHGTDAYIHLNRLNVDSPVIIE